MSNIESGEDVVGALVRDQMVILKAVSARLRNEGNKRRASFVAPAGLVRLDDLLHLVAPGEPPRVIALHVNRRIRRRADVDGDPIDARVMGDVRS